MPRHTDEPTVSEQYRSLTAQLLVHVYACLQKEVPADVAKTADQTYPFRDFTKDLCEELTRMTDHQMETIVYANNRTARALANWWEDHQEGDRQRIGREKMAENARFAKKYGHTKDKYLAIEEEFYGWDRE